MIAKLLPLLCLATTLRGYATDWPQFLGPTRNGTCSSEGLTTNWPKEGPPMVWQKTVGQGFSGPVVADHKLVIFHRVEDKETIDCLEAKTGKLLWTFAYPTAYSDDFGFDEGPRATPSIAAGRVFTFGAEGKLTCVDFSTGKKIWSVDAKAEFGAPKGFFGIACSPLIEGNALLLNIGGSDGAGIVAFDQATGKVLWKASNDEASYSSPIAATINGQRYAIFFTRAGLVGIDPANGKIHFKYPWRPPMQASVSSATPIIVGDLIFLSASYGTGAILLKVNNDSVEKIWSADHLLSNHYATSAYKDDFVYGIDGRTDPGSSPEPSLRCIELKTGALRWKRDEFGASTVTLAGDQLLLLTEKGELIRALATPDAFKENARAQVMPTQVRAYPAIADGCLFARSKNKLVCLDLTKSQP